MLRPRQRLDKYRIDARLADGGFAAVFRAYDTIEGIRVALKIPHAAVLTPEALEVFRKEVRLTARLDHPHILPIKNASFVDSRFVIVYPLGDGTLADRLQRRLSPRRALQYADQLIDALSYAHQHRIIHCDIKPENIILFGDDKIRLTDFGIAKVATAGRVSAGGTGTVGYLAPEQAMGKPTFRSDVFSLGLVLWQMFAGRLPEWPYEWPPPGAERVRRAVDPDFIAFLRRAMDVDEKGRFADAQVMAGSFHRIRHRVIRGATKRKRRTLPATRDWGALRQREFRRRFAAELQARHPCTRCGGPLAETMSHCPWCGTPQRVYRGPTTFPDRCRRCGRGAKKDWRFCAWCYGAKRPDPTDRAFSDVRYMARCANPRCNRRDLMPFMRYCPWCRAKVRRAWRVGDTRDRCRSCGWGNLPDLWSHCPWCGRRQRET